MTKSSRYLDSDKLPLFIAPVHELLPVYVPTIRDEVTPEAVKVMTAEQFGRPLIPPVGMLQVPLKIWSVSVACAEPLKIVEPDAVVARIGPEMAFPVCEIVQNRLPGPEESIEVPLQTPARNIVTDTPEGEFALAVPDLVEPPHAMPRADASTPRSSLELTKVSHPMPCS
jgi:hypothetical protein